MPELRRRPLREALVASAVHADFAVAPRLFHDPVDHRGSVPSVGFVGYRWLWTVSLAARVGRYCDVAAVRSIMHAVDVARGIGVNRKAECGRLRTSLAAAPNDDGGYCRAVFRSNGHAIVDDVRRRRCERRRSKNNADKWKHAAILTF